MEFYDSFHVEVEKELNDIERELKEIYSSNPNRNLQSPHPLEYSRDIILTAIQKSASLSGQLLLLDHLKETQFIEEGYDIGVYRHIRYLPTIWHSHSFFEIICVISGNCTHYISSQEMTMGEGDICIVAPNTMHAIRAFSDDCIVFNLVLRASTFEDTFFGTLSETDVLYEFFKHSLYRIPAHPYLYFQTGGDRQLFNFVGYVYHETIDSRPYKNRMLNNLIAAFFITMLRNHASKIILPRDAAYRSKASVIQILNYMQENYRTLAPRELSERFNYSERQIQRIIKEATGMNLHANITKLKMREAAKLLKNPNTTVASVAEELGYASVASFRQAFKNYYGETPTVFRK